MGHATGLPARTVFAMGELLTTRQAAETLGWSEGKVREKHRRLQGRKLPNGRWAFPAEAVATASVYYARLEPSHSSPSAATPDQKTGGSRWPLVLTLTAGLIAVLALFTPLFQGSSSTHLVPSGSHAAQPHARCNDGSVSYSVHRQGACSWHDGVAVWLR
jgi:hypothetical protein